MTVCYRSHLFPTETFIEALEKLYEEEFIHRAILLCLNDDDVSKYTNELNQRHYTAISITREDIFNPEPMTLLDILSQFKKHPNQILVLTVSTFQSLGSYTFNSGIMCCIWNALLSVDVPTYMMERALKRVMDAHNDGLLCEEFLSKNEFHLMWYQN